MTINELIAGLTEIYNDLAADERDEAVIECYDYNGSTVDATRVRLRDCDGKYFVEIT